jgi:hypothetical protein
VSVEAAGAGGGRERAPNIRRVKSPAVLKVRKRCGPGVRDTDHAWAVSPHPQIRPILPPACFEPAMACMDRLLIIERNAERLYAFVTELFVMAGSAMGDNFCAQKKI